MGKIKLVSDFDGIWTDQDKEAVYVKDFIISRLSEILETSKENAEKIFRSVKEEMNKEPHQHGWKNNNNIACYYQEDPFGDNNAIFEFIDRKFGELKFGNDMQEFRRKILDTGFETLEKFSNDCFFASTGKFKEEGMLSYAEKAKETADKLFDMGVDIIVASNSKTTKIEYLFDKMGIKPGREVSNGRGIFRARGNSMKFVLENDFTRLPEYFEINKNYKVPLRRQYYFCVLLDEMPDYVIGDVFSLDIALPLWLRMNDERFSNLKVIQKVQPHTPEWVQEFLGRKEFEGITFMVKDISEVPEIMR
jgi:hypothetical protein